MKSNLVKVSIVLIALFESACSQSITKYEPLEEYTDQDRQELSSLIDSLSDELYQEYKK